MTPVRGTPVTVNGGVTATGVSVADESVHLPDPHDWERHVGEDGSDGGGEDAGEEVLDGVGVDGGGGDGRGPLVVLLVDVLVQRLVVEEPWKREYRTWD